MKDPSGRHFGRYWDGEQWTDHVISAETVPSIDPASQRDREPVAVAATEDRAEPASAQERPAGWMKDPSGRHASRYWDGWRWTEHVMSAARVPGIDPTPQRNADPHRPSPAGAGAAPAAPHTEVLPAPAGAESTGSPRPRPLPLPLRAWQGFRGWTRSAQWALAIIVVGMIVIGAALTDRPPRPTVRNGGTTVTRPVETTAPSAAPPLESTTPPTTQAPITVSTTPANSGPANPPGSSPGSQPAVTSPAAVAPPATVPHPAGSDGLDDTTTS